MSFKSWCLKIWPTCFNPLTNASVKKMEKKCFSEYFTNAITKEMLRDPKRDVTTTEVDLRLSTLKPEHAKVMRKAHEFLQSGKGCNVIKASSWHHRCFKGSIRYWLYINEPVLVVVFVFKRKENLSVNFYNFCICVILMLFVTQLSWFALMIFFFISFHMHLH